MAVISDSVLTDLGSVGVGVLITLMRPQSLISVDIMKKISFKIIISGIICTCLEVMHDSL